MAKGVISGIYGLRTKSESAIAVTMHLVEGTSYDVVFRVTVSAETLTEYVPYDSNSTSQILTLSSTIYGGSVDVATATGEETWQLLPLDGNTVKFASSADGAYWNLPAGSAPGIAYGGQESTLCSHFHQVFSSNPNGFIFTKPERFTGTFDTIDALNAYISAQYAAGTPVTIAYKLAAPTHYQVTGIGEVTALAGVNTISTDADQVTVTWHEAVRADVKDVQVNGTSILTNGVASIPKAEPGKLGLTSCYNPWVGGLYVGTDGIMRIVQAPTTDIDSRANAPRPVTGNNLDYAVKAAMCDGKGAAWTADEQKAARERMGIPGGYELIEEITIAEGNVSVITRDVDRLCSAKLVIICPPMESIITANALIFFGDASKPEYIYLFGEIAPTKVGVYRHTTLEAELRNNYWRAYKTAENDTGSMYPNGSWTKLIVETAPSRLMQLPSSNLDAITKITLNAFPTGAYIPVGTKITIYGVRA